MQEDELKDYSPVYANQKNDVHPPLYYLLLRVVMPYSLNHFSKWPGIVLNIVIYAFITILMYLITNKLLETKQNHEVKAIILTLLSSISLAALTNVIYIRMYALSTLNRLITTYLHIKLYEKYDKSEKVDIKILALIGISAVIGSLTHYYYLFYLAMMYIVFMLKFLSHRDKKSMALYTATFIVAAITSLLIFPYSIKHMFFGYRGDGVISNLTDIAKWPSNISKLFMYLGLIEYYNFNMVGS